MTTDLFKHNALQRIQAVSITIAAITFSFEAALLFTRTPFMQGRSDDFVGFFKVMVVLLLVGLIACGIAYRMENKLGIDDVNFRETINLRLEEGAKFLLWCFVFCVLSFVVAYFQEVNLISKIFSGISILSGIGALIFTWNDKEEDEEVSHEMGEEIKVIENELENESKALQAKIDARKAELKENKTTKPVIEPEEKIKLKSVMQHEKFIATEDGYIKLKSHVSGTFYTAPSEDKPSYIKEGDNVIKGQELCILEAMKIIDVIESPIDGIVTDIYLKEGAETVVGQTIIRIKRDDNTNELFQPLI